MYPEMISDLSLTVQMLLDSFGYFLVPLFLVSHDLIRKYFIKFWSVRIPLTPGNLRHISLFSQIIDKLVAKCFFTQDRLPPNFMPYGFADTPGDELPVFSLCFCPYTAELTEHPVNRKAWMQLCLACSCLITRPGILFRRLYHLCSNRIQNNIATDFQQVTVLLDQNGTVPPLEQMTVPAMPFIEQLGIYSIQLAHSERQVAVRSFDKKMIVIGHQAIGMAYPIVALIDMLESVQKVLTISVVLKNRLLLISSRRYMIYCTGVLNAERSGHA